MASAAKVTSRRWETESQRLHGICRVIARARGFPEFLYVKSLTTPNALTSERGDQHCREMQSTTLRRR